MALDLPGVKNKLFPNSKRRSEGLEKPTEQIITKIDETLPIGSIISWLKNLSGTPALEDIWLECNGQVVSDGESVFNGVTLPNLNGDNRFLRGNSTSGGTGGGTTGAGSAHTHSQSGSVSSHTLIESEMPAHTHDLRGRDIAADGALVATANNFQRTNATESTGGGGGHSHNDTFSNANESSHTHSSQPKYYDVVWIIKIK